jgi:hypothetical protein
VVVDIHGFRRASLAAALSMLASAAGGQELARPICVPQEAWLEHGPSKLRFVTRCGPRSWWHLADDPAVLFKTNKIGGKVCITGQYYIPPYGQRQVCPADRKPLETPT